MDLWKKMLKIFEMLYGDTDRFIYEITGQKFLWNNS